MKKEKMEKRVALIFITIGLVFLIGGIIVSCKIFNYKDKIDTKGVISEIFSYKKSNGEIEHSVFVKYNVNGKKYESKLNNYLPSYHKGKEIKIYYNKNNPNEIGTKTVELFFLIFPAMGVLCLTIGGSLIVIKMNKKRVEEKLKQTGTLIYANYKETTVNSNYNINGEFPYVIVCEWDNPEDNKKYILKSKNIWIDPQSIIAEKNIDKFPVYINLQNKTEYFIDISEITDNIVEL